MRYSSTTCKRPPLLLLQLQGLLRDQLKSVFDVEWSTLYKGCESDTLGTLFTSAMTPASDSDASGSAANNNNNGNNTIELMGVSKLRAALEERLDVSPTFTYCSKQLVLHTYACVLYTGAVLHVSHSDGCICLYAIYYIAPWHCKRSLTVLTLLRCTTVITTITIVATTRTTTWNQS
jgi:hypothetical protein